MKSEKTYFEDCQQQDYHQDEVVEKTDQPNLIIPCHEDKLVLDHACLENIRKVVIEQAHSITTSKSDWSTETISLIQNLEKFVPQYSSFKIEFGHQVEKFIQNRLILIFYSKLGREPFFIARNYLQKLEEYARATLKESLCFNLKKILKEINQFETEINQINKFKCQHSNWQLSCPKCYLVKIPGRQGMIDDREMGEYLNLFHLDLNDYLYKTVVDLGAGEGKAMREIKNILGEFSHLITLDYYPPLKSDNLNFTQALSEELPFADNSVDLITSAFSFPYWSSNLDQCVTTLKEIARVLKPGGRAVLSPFEIYLEKESFNLSGAQIPKDFVLTYLFQKEIYPLLNSHFQQVKCSLGQIYIDTLKKWPDIFRRVTLVK